MARRRRYDTEALVGQLKAERRTGIMLSMAGIGILGILVILYAAGVGGDDELPEVPEKATTQAAATGGTAGAAAAGTAGTGGAAPIKEPEPEPAPVEPVAQKPSGPAKVELVLPKKGMVWLGKKKLGKFKKKSIEIPVGTHLIRAKIGGKTIKHTLEIKGGENLALQFDLKRRKVTVTEVP